LLISAWTSVGRAAEQDVYLIAAETTLALPDGETVTMWGFASDPVLGGDGIVRVPGPPLALDPDVTTLHIHLRNQLAEPVSIVIPGQTALMIPVRLDMDGTGRLRARSFTHETPPGGTATYTWSNFRPGSYIYHSGTHPAVQVQMGLYGGIRKDFAPGEVYENVAYDAEVIVFYSDVDPALHAAVAAGTYVPFGDPVTQMTSTVGYDPKYFLVNGEPYSLGALPLAAGCAGQDVLVRFYNAGLQTYAPCLLGQHMTVLAEDGRPYTYGKAQCVLMLSAAKTIDVLVSFPQAGTYPLFDRRGNTNNAGAAPGGLISPLEVGICP
jgi:FtsP/CotA-like multicopper oxidase with cupredoxin domain